MNKSISKVKLPGFENNVWVPTQSKKIIGIVNQVRPYTTIFAVVNTPVSLFNVEVIRQILDERIRFLNLTGRDVLRMVHVPFTTPAQSSVNTLDNAAAELAKKEDGDEKVGEDEKVDGEEKEERIEDKELKEDKDGGETDDDAKILYCTERINNDWIFIQVSDDSGDVDTKKQIKMGDKVLNVFHFPYG